VIGAGGVKQNGDLEQTEAPKLNQAFPWEQKSPRKNGRAGKITVECVRAVAPYQDQVDPVVISSEKNEVTE